MERRKSSEEDRGVSDGSVDVSFPPLISGQPSPTLKQLELIIDTIINATGTNENFVLGVTLPNVLPKMLKVNTNGATPVSQLIPDPSE